MISKRYNVKRHYMRAFKTKTFSRRCQTEDQAGRRAADNGGVDAMHLSLSAAAGLIGCALVALQPATAAHGGSGMNSGVYNSSMMAVQRERQEKIKNCVRLRPNFDSGTMTYVGRDGRPHSCP
jgi:hypothetical protein